MKRNVVEMKERWQRQQQVLTKIEQQWLELEHRLTELESRLPELPEGYSRSEDSLRKPR